MPATPSRAIFLSYARDDTEPARRIADGLRAFGLEVWFDQNELRGGDVWDADIRRQIRECALFMPLISARTEDRHEGYFRREWRLAIDRMHDMAEGVPFLFPIVIDETSEAEALVPEIFKSVQWTRLPHGLPDSEFVQRVRDLLEGRKRPASTISPAGGAAVPLARSPDSKPAKSRPFILWGGIAIAALVVVLLAANLIVHRAPRADQQATTSSATVAASDEAAQKDKSIAVLPFRNMSADANNAYFCDGVQEDILTQLANIGDLRVISRTSVMQYRDSTKPIRQIAQELGCAYVLEGSVQRADNRVRVTGQLINAHSDEHLWAKSYDRDLTDIFAIQSQLAREISSSLQAVLTPAESNRLAKLPTKVPAAYDLVLKARALRGELGNTREMSRQTESFLVSATELDPDYADAWAELSYTRVTSYFWYYDHSQAELDRAKDAIDRAVKLAPDDPGVMMGIGNYYYYGFRDYDRAREEYQRVAALLPNNAEVIASLGYIGRRQGQWAQAIKNLTHAFELDPRNLALARDLCTMFQNLCRYEDARKYARAMIDLAQDPMEGQWQLGTTDYRESGSLKGVEAALRLMATKAVPGSDEEAELIRHQANYAYATGDAAGWLKLHEKYPPSTFNLEPREADEATGEMLFFAGRMDDARPYLERALEATKAEIALAPDDATLWTSLADIQVCLGQRDEALTSIQKAVDLLPESRDALNGPLAAMERAWILWMAGHHDEALEETARLVRTPWGMNVHFLRLSVQWAPARHDPRFMAIVNDPKNNEPLF